MVTPPKLTGSGAYIERVIGTIRRECLDHVIKSPAVPCPWAGGQVVNTQVSYRLELESDGTRLLFEHSGFDVSQPWGDNALRGAELGWTKMLERLSGAVVALAAHR